MTWQIVNSIKISISHRINVAFSYFDGGNTPHVCVSVANNPIYLIRYFYKKHAWIEWNIHNYILTNRSFNISLYTCVKKRTTTNTPKTVVHCHCIGMGIVCDFVWVIWLACVRQHTYEWHFHLIVKNHSILLIYEIE